MPAAERSQNAPEDPKPPHEAHDGPVTTMMIRNLPNRLQPKQLMLLMEEIGWADTYDYVYMPQDRKSGACKGYAFLNFYRPEHADSFPDMVAQGSWTKKKLVVTPARCQGVMKNLEQMVSLGLEVPDGSVFNKPWVRVGNEMKPLAAPAAYAMYKQF